MELVVIVVHTPTPGGSPIMPPNNVKDAARLVWLVLIRQAAAV